MPKVLVIGESGQLAQSLRQLHWPAGLDLDFIGRRSLSSPFSFAIVRALFDQFKPDLVLNAAAYTGVDRAESEREAAFSLNAGLPRALAGTCKGLEIPLVHVSTDYVFNGEKRTPYLETDAPDPLGVYGLSKLEGDRNVEQSDLARWAILRTSWVVSEIGETFPVKLLRRAQAGEALRVVDDQWGCPTAASDLARAMQSVGLRLLDDDRAACGLFNFSGASDMSWHGFADKLLAAAEAMGLKRPPLQAITSAELKAPARRPAYSVLSCARIKQACDIAGARIEDDLERMVRRILAT
ncbi:MAG TPA: dTDP-4-dehydrorhamnose reductase [Dongiaceae bacterium]|nr:dTDP-4-dehydrorhamnose reductase [Dongiaceae bacterium]